MCVCVCDVLIPLLLKRIYTDIVDESILSRLSEETEMGIVIARETETKYICSNMKRKGSVFCVALRASSLLQSLVVIVCAILEMPGYPPASGIGACAEKVEAFLLGDNASSILQWQLML